MNHERLKVHPGCLMVFVDETGHEEFADPNYPVFGFGGCAVPAFRCADVLERPWREMKEPHFGGADVALHASDLRQPTPEQLEALGAFFRDKRFGRFAVTMCRDVSLPEGESPIEAMRGALTDRWSELASRVDPTPMEVAFLFEASERGSPLIGRYFGPTIVHVVVQRIPAHNGFIEKRFGLEGLEVAAFIAHAAGLKLTRITEERAASARTLTLCSARTTFGRAGFISTPHHKIRRSGDGSLSRITL